MNPKWECLPIGLSGNTDCYQPAERKFGIPEAYWKYAMNLINL